MRKSPVQNECELGYWQNIAACWAFAIFMFFGLPALIIKVVYPLVLFYCDYLEWLGGR